jgi:hypothetical protein
MGRRQEGREKLLNGLSWFVVIIIAGAALSHWLTGFPSNQVVKPLGWIFIAVCVLGLINALGFFDGQSLKRDQTKALLKLAEVQNRALVNSIRRIQTIEAFLQEHPTTASDFLSNGNVTLPTELESGLDSAVQALEKTLKGESD